MTKATARLVKKAESDWLLAVEAAHLRHAFYDQVCFQCQQSAEKYFKAFLQELGLPVPKIHDLDALLTLLLPYDLPLRALRRGLNQLSRYAVEYRYPGQSATKRDMQSALRKAERIRREIRTRLGLAV